MLKIQSKKGIAIIILMELIILTTLIIIYISAAAGVVGSTEKFAKFDSQNIALFLERIPSITENFYYPLELSQKSNILITETSVSIAKNSSINYKYLQNYYNPRAFQFTEELQNTDIIHIYKINSKVYFEKEKNSLLESQLYIKDQGVGQKHSSVDLQNVGEFTTIRQISPNILIDSSSPLSWLAIKSKDKKYADVEIYYSLDAKNDATIWFNEIIKNNIDQDNSLIVTLIPDNTFRYFIENDIPIPERKKITTVIYSENAQRIYVDIQRYFNE